MINSHAPPNQKEILDVLEEIAEPIGDQWKLKERYIKTKQDTLLSHTKGLPRIIFKTRDEKENHNQMIVALAGIARLLGYKIWIGKKEQGQKFKNLKLKDFCDFEELPFLDIKKDAEEIIEQIDIIWFKEFEPVAAFEIENTTNVQRGIIRFVNLIKKVPEISSKLYVVCPNSRESKVVKELTNPAFIGMPLYIEKRVKYIVYSSFIMFYREVQSNPNMGISIKDIDMLSRVVKV